MSLLSEFLTKFPLKKRVIMFLTRINVWGYRLTNGRFMNTVDGTPVCLVTMTGRKSGKKRTIAIMYNPRGEDVILVASLRGAEKHPVWYYNIKAKPKVEVQAGSVKRKMRARIASPEEKRELWPMLVHNFRSYADYQEKTDRDIPVIICSPVSGHSSGGASVADVRTSNEVH